MNLLAFLWGFAEATVFFVVPDVALSVIGLKGRRAGLVAVAYAVAGAVLGGALMYWLGRWDRVWMGRLVDGVWGIRPNDATFVRAALEQYGWLAIFQGVVQGIQYKLYAINAPLSMSFLTFFLISIPARAIRFLLMGVALPWFLNFQLPTLDRKFKTGFILAMWVLFYILFLSTH